MRLISLLLQFLTRMNQCEIPHGSHRTRYKIYILTYLPGDQSEIMSWIHLRLQNVTIDFIDTKS